MNELLPTQPDTKHPFKDTQSLGTALLTLVSIYHKQNTAFTSVKLKSLGADKAFSWEIYMFRRDTIAVRDSKDLSLKPHSSHKIKRKCSVECNRTKNTCKIVLEQKDR